MNVKVDGQTMLDGIETAKNLTKIMANWSDKKAESKPEPQILKEGDTSTNQPHTQTVEVKVGEQGNSKPVVLKEKHETHVHKPFPEGRELSERECKVEEMRLKNEHEFRMAELNYRIAEDTRNRNDRKEREAYERRERERRQEENRRANRRLAIGAAVFGAFALGTVSYCCYLDSRNNRVRQYSLPKPAMTTVPGEGTVA